MYSLVTQIGTFSFGREIEIDVHWCNILSLEELFRAAKELLPRPRGASGVLEVVEELVDDLLEDAGRGLVNVLLGDLVRPDVRVQPEGVRYKNHVIFIKCRVRTSNPTSVTHVGFFEYRARCITKQPFPSIT